MNISISITTQRISQLTKALRDGGRIARMRSDCNNPKWNNIPRSISNSGLNSAPPQTVTFSDHLSDGKGPKSPLTPWMDRKVRELNGDFVYSKLMIPAAGWINTGDDPEKLTWAQNDLIVIGKNGVYADCFAIDYRSEDLPDTFFTKNGRLGIHKFNAINKDCKAIKLANGYDAFTPFITATQHSYIRSEYLEFWPALPMKVVPLNGLSPITIVEYELWGYETYAITDKNSRICLYRPGDGYLTSWKLETPGVPV